MSLVGNVASQFVTLGTTVGVSAQFRGEDGTPFNPLNSVSQVKIVNPQGVVSLDWTNMEPRDTGTFLHLFQTNQTDPKGTWRVFVRGQLLTGSNPYIMDAAEFFAETSR